MIESGVWVVCEAMFLFYFSSNGEPPLAVLQRSTQVVLNSVELEAGVKGHRRLQTVKRERGLKKKEKDGGRKEK